MKIEIKKLKVNHRLSEETLNFSCDIHVDGKRVGWAGNRGTGGQTDIGDMTPAMLAKLTAYANEHYTEAMGAIRWSEGDRKGNLVDGVAQYIDHLVHEEESTRAAEKSAKRVAKYDAEEKKKNDARGMGTLRWVLKKPLGTDTRWSGFPKGENPQVAADRLTAKYAKNSADSVTWEVI